MQQIKITTETDIEVYIASVRDQHGCDLDFDVVLDRNSHLVIQVQVPEITA